jgi:hypothetical protein
MSTNVLNITDICLKNFTELTAKEFDIWLEEHCDLPTERPTEPLTTGYVAYYSLLISAGFVLNLLVMITIFSRNRLRTIPNAFMVSLSVADILLATVAIPLRLVERLNRNKNYDITSVVYPCIGVASIFSLCCVTLDRYMHIRHHLNYEKHMNKKRAIGIVAGLWVFSVLQAAVFIFVYEHRINEAIYNDVRVVICFVIPAIFVCVTYTKLIVIARSHARVIAATSITIPNLSCTQKKDFKILKVIALVVGTLVLCWFPFLVTVSYELHHDTARSRKFHLFKDIAECLACSTCVLNPVIYGLLRRDLRISMRYVVACKRESIEERESL